MSTIISRDERILAEMNRREQAWKRLQGSYKFWMVYSTLMIFVGYLSGERPSLEDFALCICLFWTKLMQWCVRGALKKFGYHPPKWLPKNGFIRSGLPMIAFCALMDWSSKCLPVKSEHTLGETDGWQLALRIGIPLFWSSA